MRIVVVVVNSDHRPQPVIAGPRRVVAGRRRRPVPLPECLYADPDTPAQPGQHQQQAETDEAHADDLRRRPDADDEGDSDRYGTDKEKAGTDGDDDQRTSVVGGDYRHRGSARTAPTSQRGG